MTKSREKRAAKAAREKTIWPQEPTQYSVSKELREEDERVEKNTLGQNKRVLFLIDKYDQRPYIGGVCVRNVAGALRDEGVETHILAFQAEGACPENEKPYVHYFTPGIIERLFLYAEQKNESALEKLAFRTAQCLSKTRKLVMLHWYPEDTVRLPRTIVRHIEKLDLQYRFDAVISVQSRISFSVAGYLWKKKHPDRVWLMYCVDSYADGNPIRFISDRRRIEGGKQLDRKFLELVDQFYMVECHKSFYEQPYYDEFRQKIQYVDIPLYLPKQLDSPTAVPQQTKGKWVYAGSLHEFGYNPWKLCEVFLHLPDADGRTLFFFSRGNCESKLKKLSEKSGGRIVSSGYISAERLKTELRSADVLVSIGIENSSQVSGKIFDYFCNLKRVVHFSSGNGDPNLPYLKKYPYSFCATKDSELDQTVQELSTFLKQPIEPDEKTKAEIDRLFLKNQPSYAAGLIKSYIEKENAHYE